MIKLIFCNLLTKKIQQIDTQMCFGNKHITNVHSSKFLGLAIDSSFSWKYHIEELKKYKLNKARYTIRSVKLFMSSTNNDLFVLCSLSLCHMV
jgi:hypothetical protein